MIVFLIKENLLEGAVTSKGLYSAVNLASVTPAAERSHSLQGKIAGSEEEDKWLPLCPGLNRTMALARFLKGKGLLCGGYWRHL